MIKILLIEDDEDIQSINAFFLRSKGHEVHCAFSCAQGLDMCKAKMPDCIVLDVNLPDGTGLDLCPRLRQVTQAPIIFLSCMDTEDDKIAGLLTGGDDYMTKPYSVRELLARINAQIRRNKVFDRMDEGVESPRPSVMYDKEARVIAIRGINIFMSHKEYAIITKLVASAGELVPKGELMALVSGEESTLFTCIKRIRSKLEMDDVLGSIETIFGEGYKYIPSKDE